MGQGQSAYLDAIGLDGNESTNKELYELSPPMSITDFD